MLVYEYIICICYNSSHSGSDLMEEQDVIKLLQYYQHDFLNELQIIQGYASLDKPETIKDKIDACVSLYQEERKLIHLNIPKFALWIMRTPHDHQNIRLSYEIHLEQIDLFLMDQTFLDIGELLVKHINEYERELELYELHIRMEHNVQPSSVSVVWHILGELDEIDHLKSNFNHLFSNTLLDIQVHSDKVVCKYLEKG